MEGQRHQGSSSESRPAPDAPYPRRASFLFTGFEYQYNHARTNWNSDQEAAPVHQGPRGGTNAIARNRTTSETTGLAQNTRGEAIFEWPTAWENWTSDPQPLHQEARVAPYDWIICPGLAPQVVHLVAMQSIPEAQIDSELLNWSNISDSDVEEDMTDDQFTWHWPAEENDIYEDGDLNVDDIPNEDLLELAEHMENINIGLSREIIQENISCRRFSSAEKVKECCICMGEYHKDADRLGILDCAHEFHFGCIVEWLGRKNTCPICRRTGLAIPETNQ